MNFMSREMAKGEEQQTDTGNESKQVRYAENTFQLTKTILIKVLHFNIQHFTLSKEKTKQSVIRLDASGSHANKATLFELSHCAPKVTSVDYTCMTVHFRITSTPTI